MKSAPDAMDLRAVRKLTGLTARAIRFYDENGLVSPKRTVQNQRVFDTACVERLELIALLRRAGMTLVDIRCVLTLRDYAPDGAQAATLALRSLDAEARRLQAQLATVNKVARVVRRRLDPEIRPPLE